MSQDAYPMRSQEPGDIETKVRLIGTGAAAPTKVYGKGITPGRTALGVYTLTFDSLPGILTGMVWGFDGATPLNLAGCTVVLTTPTAGSLVYTVTVYSGSTTPAARELAATEVLNLTFTHKKTSA